MESLDKLKVDFAQLSELGKYLSNEDFDKKFQELSTNMSTVKDSWFDLEGENYEKVFTAFVTDAKKISDCVEVLGSFSSGMAVKYEDTLNTYVEKMKSVL